MDNIWKTFRAAKLGTSAAWALGVTSMTAMLGQSPAHAFQLSFQLCDVMRYAVAWRRRGRTR